MTRTKILDDSSQNTQSWYILNIWKHLCPKTPQTQIIIKISAWNVITIFCSSSSINNGKYRFLFSFLLTLKHTHIQCNAAVMWTSTQKHPHQSKSAPKSSRITRCQSSPKQINLDIMAFNKSFFTSLLITSNFHWG